MDAPTCVLHIEHDDFTSQVVQLLLGKARVSTFLIQRARSVGEAIALAHDTQFDVILLDLHLPDNVGLDALPRLKAAAPSVPIIVLTGPDEDGIAIDAIRQGAQECLAKEHVMGDLLTRMIRHSIARQQQLQDALAQALKDPLTGIGNRRAFATELDRRLTDWKRHRTTFSVALFDIDHFKLVNDSYGHDAGDKVLCNIASVLNRTTRDTDLVVRYGGEEFGILFPVTRLDEAGHLAHRIRQIVAVSDCGSQGQKLSITTSAGVAEVADDDDGRSVLRRADDALYAAKDAGRNCCRLHNGMCVTPPDQIACSLPQATAFLTCYLALNPS